MTTITGKQALEALRKAVELRGADFIYPEEWRTESHGQCRYVHEGQPACIVGVALDTLGVNLIGRANASADALLINPSWSDVDVTLEATRIFYRAQVTQDNRQTWGAALAAAEQAAVK